jgi:cytochrome c oxidase subunit 2
VLTGLGALALSGCSSESWKKAVLLGWPEGITPQAERMRNVWTGSVIAAAVIGVLVWGLIFWALIRYRKRGEELPVQTRYNLPIETLYTIVPFLIIAVLFYYTAITQNFVTKETANPDVTVSVNAFKWNWRFAYPNELDQQNRPIETVGSSDQVPVLVVPTGQTIRFVETSEDVIHSFWVPDILFKRDVIPGRQNSFEITVEKPGAYVGRCAELCGTYHAQMNFEMRAVSQEKYQQWVGAKRSGMSTPDALQQIGEPPLSMTTAPFKTSRQSGSAVTR